MRIDNNHLNPNFKGPLDGAATTVLRTLDTNPMANAVGIDLFAMVAPRTYVDTKDRNKYAGAETFFREFTGTLIVCLSASYFAKGIAKLANKFIQPDTKINANSWFSADSLEFLETLNKKGDYNRNLLDSISGLDGNKVKNLKDIDWSKVEWIDEKKWSNYKWDNTEFENIHEKLKDKDSIISILDKISLKEVSEKDSKKVLNILEVRLTNVLGADKVSAKIEDKEVNTSLHNLLRDSVDMNRDIIKNKNVNLESALKKIKKINGIKSAGALILASSLGLTNQYINRKITEKRTGKKGFVGDIDYDKNTDNQTSPKDEPKNFLIRRLSASLGIAALAVAVMGVKSPKDFVKKLEFTGPVTGGNAIKTVYASTLIGRFMASDSNDELRESTTRDYLGFLNWLVLGGFAAKGSANLLDTKRESLFNTSKEGKGVRHWLNDVSLKSHNEIAAKGSEFSKKNMWKLNVAHAAGLAYSTLALGVLLPKLNIWMTKRKQSNNLIKS